MAHTIGIINGKAPSGGVGGVSDADLSSIAINFLSAGVVGADDYKVEQQATPNMTVKVNTGRAYVFKGDGSNAYETRLDASVNATIDDNNDPDPRIDAIVIKIDLGATPNNLASNVASILVVEGTPAASPSAPSDSDIQTAVGAGNPFYRLANVTVANGATSISDADISGTRGLTGFGQSAGSGGWTPAGQTWTYASADDPTFTLTISGDHTATYSPGMRVKLTQTTEKYFIITKVAHSGGTTTLTLYGGTDYDLANAAITNPYYSMMKAPVGFPLDPTKWTVLVTDSTDRSQAAAAAGTWYNIGTTNSQISIPIGCWDVQYFITLQQDAAASIIVTATLSTANNSESDANNSASFTSSASFNGGTVSKKNVISVAAKTTYYLNAKTPNAGTPTLYFRNGTSGAPMRLEARCAYL